MITRDVEPRAVADLALAPPRAALAAVVDGEIIALPVDATLEQPADPASSPRQVRVPSDAPDLAGREVVVVADDGPQWFRLRSLTVRGPAEAVGDRLYRVSPRRVVAWDYGALRGVPAEPLTGERRRCHLLGPWTTHHRCSRSNSKRRFVSHVSWSSPAGRARAHRSLFRCGSSCTTAASMRGRRFRRGRSAMSRTARRSAFCWVVNAAAKSACSYVGGLALSPERRRRQC